MKARDKIMYNFQKTIKNLLLQQYLLMFSAAFYDSVAHPVTPSPNKFTLGGGGGGSGGSTDLVLVFHITVST
jgi:hypothetical protein